MAVALRLKRIGSHKNPHYRIVAADERFARDGRFLEELGHYNPQTDPATVKIHEEKIMKWLGEGAQPSDTVRSILKKEGVLKKFHESKLTKLAAVPASE
jgi:small subunit ribosomal protein S16